MTWGFKVFDQHGNIVCDGTSLMLRLHASGSQYVAKGGTWTFNFNALDHEPVFIVQSDPLSNDWKAKLVKTGANWTGVQVDNHNTTWAVAATFYLYVYKRK